MQSYIYPKFQQIVSLLEFKSVRNYVQFISVPEGFV